MFKILNIELTSRCNKNCWMCGRRKVDRDYPEIAMEDLKEIADELQDVSMIEQAPAFEGRTLLMVLAPDTGKK